MRAVVSREVRYKCLVCGRTFSSLEEFKKHREEGLCRKK